MANEQYTSPNMSRSEEIVQATIDGTEYNKPSQSRLETLLIELKEVVEAGGGESSDYATALSLTIDSSTYIITARLLNKDGNTLGTAQTIDLPLESVVMSGYYNSYTQMIVLTLQNGSTIEFSVADLVSGLQTEITSTNKLDADLVDDSTSTNKFVTSAEKSTWNNKQNVLTVGTNLDDEPIEDSTNPITSGGVYNTVGNIDLALDSLIMSLEPKTITANGTYNPVDDGVDGYSEVTVNVPSGGGGGSTNDDVVFYDYDGSVVTSYSAADFANLSEMPANPTHEGLTAQGWNWSLADAKAYVASYGKLNIGQMYTTSDGKTRLYVTVTKSNLSLDLYLELGSDTELDVDWGDGSEHTRWTSDEGSSSQYHDYTSAGRYVIAIEVIAGEFYSTQALSNMYKIEIGNGVTSIDSQAFNSCQALSSITIPNGVTSIGREAFNQCQALTSITIPDSVTSIDREAFYCCSSLSSITIPNSVTSIGGEAFYSCYSISSITIPNSVTSIESCAFNSCYSLTSITIPDNVTSIDSQAFYSCQALPSITIPNSVTSIESEAFYSCYALSSVTFESTTPPELNDGLDIPNTCIIRVPQGSLSAYTSASNYPDPSEYIYEEY